MITLYLVKDCNKCSLSLHKRKEKSMCPINVTNQKYDFQTYYFKEKKKQVYCMILTVIIV